MPGGCFLWFYGIYDEKYDSFGWRGKSLYDCVLRLEVCVFCKLLIDIMLERPCILLTDIGLHKKA